MKHIFKFTNDQYDMDYNVITVQYTHEYFVDNIRHQREVGGYIPEVIVISPTGGQMEFTHPSYFYGGMRYSCKVDDKTIYLKIMFK